MCEKCGCSEVLESGSHPVLPHDSGVAVALSHNDRLAERNRGFCSGKRICMINLLSFPRSNVQALLARTLREYGQRRRMAVLTMADLEKMEALHDHHSHEGHGHHGHVHAAHSDDPAVVDAHAVGHALSHLDLDHLDLVLIENSGSAACQAVYDLGETARVAIFSVREGELKPLKFPLFFAQARGVVINEIDQVGATGFDVAKARDHLAQVAAQAQRMELSPETGAGFESWYAFLDGLVKTNGK